MIKSPNAFRTISEVAEWLDTPAYVLRFWEGRFSQIKPVKRAGGRRYYRPHDMLLLGGIKQLLHVDKRTIDDVKKILKDQGVEFVTNLSRGLQTQTVSTQRKHNTLKTNEPPEKQTVNNKSDNSKGLVSGSVRNAPFRIATANAYDKNTMAEIETLYYELRMARSSMRRANNR
jgi:DNA-binding transcriptional MerR regulator